MPTVARIPRARVICEIRPASAAPERECEQGAGHAAAPWTPRASATLPARRTRRCPLDTAPACDASCAPVTPPPAGDLAGVRRELRAGDAAARWRPGRRATRAARRRRRRPLRPGPPRNPPARRNRRRLRSFRPCLKIPRPRAGAPTVRKRTLRHPISVRKRMSTVSGLRPCPTGCPLGPAPAAYAGGRGHAAPFAGCCRGAIARAAPANPPRSGAPAAGAACFGVGAPCWRTLRAAPSRFAR